MIINFSYKKNRKVSLMGEAKNERETLHEIFGKYENHCQFKNLKEVLSTNSILKIAKIALNFLG
jgi:predicted MarR family transcription regulator